MPLKINRLGASRGPDNRNYTDIYNQLVIANDHLGTIRMVVVYMLSVFAGDATGLPSNFNIFKGIFDRLEATRLADLQALDEAAARTASYSNIAAIKTAVEALDAGADYTQLITRIANTLRQEGELPADTSIFRLLASLDTNMGRAADCCEDNAGGGGDPGGGNGTPPAGPPTDICAESVDGQQAAALVERGTTTVNGVACKVFVVDFGPMTQTPLQSSATSIPTGTWSNLKYNGTQNFVTTISWDFSGVEAEENIPLAFTLIEAINSEPDGSNFAAVEPVIFGDMTRGCSSYDMGQCADGPEDYRVYYLAFAFPSPATAPAPYVWVTTDDIGCAS